MSFQAPRGAAPHLRQVQVDLVTVKVGVERRAVGVVEADGALKWCVGEGGRGGERAALGRGALGAGRCGW